MEYVATALQWSACLVTHLLLSLHSGKPYTLNTLSLDEGRELQCNRACCCTGLKLALVAADLSHGLNYQFLVAADLSTHA